MNTQTEALKMAIEAMEDLDAGHPICTSDLLQACKEALAQPAQEPVAWMHRHEGEITEFNDFQSCDKCEPLYTHPAPSWQGLSDDEITNLEADHDIKVSHDTWEFDFYGFARAIEQALRSKNDKSS